MGTSQFVAVYTTPQDAEYRSSGGVYVAGRPNTQLNRQVFYAGRADTRIYHGSLATKSDQNHGRVTRVTVNGDGLFGVVQKRRGREGHRKRGGLFVKKGEETPETSEEGERDQIYGDGLFVGGNKGGVTRGTSATLSEEERRVRGPEGDGAGSTSTRGTRRITVFRRWGREVGDSTKARVAARRRGRTWVHRTRYPAPRIFLVADKRAVNTRRAVRLGAEKARWWCQRDRGVKSRAGDKSVRARGGRR